MNFFSNRLIGKNPLKISTKAKVIQKLLNDPVIQSCKISDATESTFEAKQGICLTF